MRNTNAPNLSNREFMIPAMVYTCSPNVIPTSHCAGVMSFWVLFAAVTWHNLVIKALFMIA